MRTLIKIWRKYFWVKHWYQRYILFHWRSMRGKTPLTPIGWMPLEAMKKEVFSKYTKK